MPRGMPSNEQPGPMRPPDVAETVADLTPEWLSGALSRPGDEVEATAVTAERVGTGQIGTAYRLQLTYTDGADRPTRLVAKLASEDPGSRAAIADGYRKEVGFYRHIAPTVDVRVPTCWYDAISEDGTVFTLLLEDLAPARPGVQVDGCTPGQATAAARNIAGLHAPRWDDPSLADHSFLSHVDEDAAAFIGALHEDATGHFVKRFGDQLAAADVATLREAATATATWLLAGSSPFSLTHGDYRLDNLMFHPDGDEVVALDWQTLSLGPPGRDLAYLLGTSLEPEARRSHETSIVAAYHSDLVTRGVMGYGADRCFADYRLGQLQGPLITVLGCEFATAQRTARADAMFLAMARRSCSAIRDLTTLDLLS